jgi:hypothetical protein
MILRYRGFASIVLLALIVLPVDAANDVVGRLLVFNDNGAWSWFESERAIVDSSTGKLLLSSVANAAGPGGAERNGDVEVVSYDFKTQSKTCVALSKHLQADDHNSAALVALPGGRYLASYSKHAGDNCLRYRVSRKPGDAIDWEAEKVFYTAGPTTYSNLCYLSEPNTIFNFHRDLGRGFDPNYVVWRLGHDQEFSYGGRLLTGPEGNAGHRDRPYLRYVSNGVNRIHFITTDHHPRNLVTNSIYHGYIEFHPSGYVLYRSDGTRLGNLSAKSTSPYKASDFTPLFRGGTVSPTNDLRMTRAWPIDIELDSDGDPYVAFTARVADNDLDHRFFYARLKNGQWQLHELAKAGGHLYDSENDYTGLAALDPTDPDRVFISTNLDPNSVVALPHYELFLGTTSDRGASWTWQPITKNSTVDNMRPIVPRGAHNRNVLLWMRGTYKAYTQYNTEIVGVLDERPNREMLSSVNPPCGNGKLGIRCEVK